MLCLSGFEQYSRWVPLGTWTRASHYQYRNLLLVNASAFPRNTGREPTERIRNFL